MCGCRWRVPRKDVVKLGWVPSIGEDLFKEHFREPPLGRRHAVCCGEWCEVHEDRVNPLEDPIGHLVYDAPHVLAAFVVGGLSGYYTYLKSRNLMGAAAAAVGFGLLSYVVFRVLLGG